MTTTATSGVVTTLLATFESAGVLTNPTEPITLTVTPSAGGAAVLTTTAVVNVTAGTYSFPWTPPSVDEATDYVVTWDPSGDDVSATEIVRVFPSYAGAWATIEQVALQTGVTVTAATLALASGIIDTFTGADIEMPEDAITTKDRRHLRKATAWQAVWVAPKAGLITERENATSLSSDGQRVERADRADAMLAPLARREIMNLSWVGTRSVLVPPTSDRANRANFLNEASDVYGEWVPL